jgi:hypothetical protein
VEKAHLHLHRLGGIQVHTVLYFNMDGREILW